jgi:predicted CoA-binding protein
MLDDTRRIAVVGLSSNPARASYGVTRYLASAGFIVSGVNPSLAGQEIAGAAVYATLGDIPGPLDLVDVFRREDALPGVTDDVIRLADSKEIRYLWFQLGLVDHRAAERAREAGITVVMDRCLKVEHARLTPG